MSAVNKKIRWMKVIIELSYKDNNPDWITVDLKIKMRAAESIVGTLYSCAIILLQLAYTSLQNNIQSVFQMLATIIR